MLVLLFIIGRAVLGLHCIGVVKHVPLRNHDIQFRALNELLLLLSEEVVCLLADLLQLPTNASKHFAGALRRPGRRSRVCGLHQRLDHKVVEELFGLFAETICGQTLKKHVVERLAHSLVVESFELCSILLDSLCSILLVASHTEKLRDVLVIEGLNHVSV